MSQILRQGPPLDMVVPNGGYAWWYLDAISDDGASALTAIVFVGSVFSPWYFKARQQGPADPLAHAAINVSIRHHGKVFWVMNERAISAKDRAPESLQLGPGTRLFWQQGQLFLTLDEATKPFFQHMPGRLRGTVVLTPLAHHGQVETLDAAGRHRWCPVAPHAQLNVQLEAPGIHFAGKAYHDANWGDEPLEAAFAGWHWSRAPLRDSTAVCYDTTALDGSRRALFRSFGRDGTTDALPAPAQAPLPSGKWGVQRATATSSGTARVVHTLEDSPFYVRSLVAGDWQGQPALAVHESLDLRRFCAPWVRFLLPFRSRRESTVQPPAQLLTSFAPES